MQFVKAMGRLPNLPNLPAGAWNITEELDSLDDNDSPINYLPKRYGSRLRQSPGCYRPPPSLCNS